jgi:hypothetical protein
VVQAHTLEQQLLGLDHGAWDAVSMLGKLLVIELVIIDLSCKKTYCIRCEGCCASGCERVRHVCAGLAVPQCRICSATVFGQDSLSASVQDA